MDKVFWLREGVVAGRSGPNKDIWNVEDFQKAGFSAILSVNDAECVHESLIRLCDMAYAHIPMSDNAPAREGDLDVCLRYLPDAVKFILTHQDNGPVLVHCRSGKDRTGLVMAAYLMFTESLNTEQAMKDVLSVRDIAFSAPGWIPFAAEVLNAYQQSIQSF